MRTDVICQTTQPVPNEAVDAYHLDVTIGSVWFNSTDSSWHKCTSITPLVFEDVPAPTHLHPTLGDVNFTGTVSAGGYAGVTQRVTIGTKKLTFKEGICILVEDA